MNIAELIAELREKAERSANNIPAMARMMPGVEDALNMTFETLDVLDEMASTIEQQDFRIEKLELAQ